MINGIKVVLTAIVTITVEESVFICYAESPFQLIVLFHVFLILNTLHYQVITYRLSAVDTYNCTVYFMLNHLDDSYI